MYPEYAEINGKEYKIDTDFRTALQCFKVVGDETITEDERARAIVYLLFDFIPKDELLEEFLKKAIMFLQCGQTTEEQKNKKKDMDFEQDRGLINASFMSDYRIDLSKEKLHFWQFIELIEGLTENCCLNRVRELRNYDLSEEKDSKRKNKIKKAKEAVALKEHKKIEEKNYSSEQLKNMEEFYKLMEGKE